MSVKRPSVRDKQPLAVKRGLVTGSVVVVAKGAGDRATYEWQYSQVGEPWIDLEPTRQAKKIVEGLVTGRTYQFRVRSVTQAGRSDFGQVVRELREMLCTTAAGGCGQAEALRELRETLCTTVAGGCGQAEALRELRETLCATAAGGCGQAEALRDFRETLCTTVAGGCGQAETPSLFPHARCALVAG
jgi:hypothetical protein